MRELTIYDLDTELAEQLPARELMSCCRQGATYDNQSVNVLSIGSGNNGSYNGIANGNEVQVEL